MPPLAVGLPPIVSVAPAHIICIPSPALTVGIAFTCITLLAVAVQLKPSVTVIT